MINRRRFLIATATAGVGYWSAPLNAAYFKVHQVALGQTSSAIQRLGRLITPERLRSRLYFIASDLFEGRRTGTRGQQLTASYLGSEYAHMGFAPAIHTSDRSLPESFYQRFLCYITYPKSARLSMVLSGKTLQAANTGTNPQCYFAGTDFRDVNASLVFAGYGIEDRDAKYQEYSALRERGVSIDGKWVLILDGEPKFLAGKDGKPSKWARSVFAKRVALQAAGKAQGVLIVSDWASISTDFRNHVKQAADGFPLRLRFDWPPSSNPVALVIARDLASEVFNNADTSVDTAVGEIERSKTPINIDLGNVSVRAAFESFAPLESENVIAVLEGSDPVLRKEFVVISAHHDHLGIDPTISGDQIFNGAADDGSGTVAVLEMASVFSRAKAEGVGPRRSLVFLHTSGEEASLL